MGIRTAGLLGAALARQDDPYPVLADFELSDLGLWVEVKGDNSRLDKALLLDVADGQWSGGPPRGVLVLGPVPRPPDNALPAHTLLTDADPHGHPVRGRGVWHRLGVFTASGRVEIADAWDCVEPMSMESDPCRCDWLRLDVDTYSHAVTQAYFRARSARFEFGEAS